MSLDETGTIGMQPSDSIRDAKTTDQSSSRFYQDNMTIVISFGITIAISASGQKPESCLTKPSASLTPQ
jgi:hypothetical protein